MDFRVLRCFDNFLIRGIRAAVTDIFQNRPREEKHILLDDPNVPAQAFLRQITHILSIHKNGTFRDVIKSRDQMADGCLSSA